VFQAVNFASVNKALGGGGRVKIRAMGRPDDPVAREPLLKGKAQYG